MVPGCQSDSMLILEGKQGAKKSSKFMVLAEAEYFSDNLPQLHTKDAALHLFVKWIIELAERASLIGAKAETQKTFHQDHFGRMAFKEIN
jgi:putative DNA primase/helicase